MNIVTNTPRHLRSQYRRDLTAGKHKLYVVSPKITSLRNWRYGILVGGDMHILKAELPSRDFGRQDSERRFGVKAVEYRRPQRHGKAA